MIDLENKCITLNNNDYEIIETVWSQNKLYAYLVNVDDELDSMFKEIRFENNYANCYDIDSELFKTTIVQLFIEKFENY